MDDYAKTPDQLIKELKHLRQRISELEVCEDSKQRLEERFQLAIEASDGAVWDWNIAEGTIFRSESFFRMFGYEERDFPGRQGDWHHLVFPEDLLRVQDHLQDYFSGLRQSHEIDFRVRTRSGDVVWIMSRGKVVAWDDQGKPQRMVGVHVNITRFKEMERELRQINTWLGESQRIAKIGTWEWDEITGKTYWSEELYQILGFEPRSLPPTLEIAGKLIHPDDFPRWRRDLDAVLESGDSIQREFRVVRQDGSIAWVQENGLFMRDPDGKVTRVVGTSQDVTDRKHREELLKEQEERMRLALEATNDVIWDWDVLNDSQRWNTAGKVVFGWSDIVETPQTGGWWVDRVHPDDRQRVSDNFYAAVNDHARTSWRDRYRFMKADGTFAIVADRGYIIRNDQGMAVRMVGAMRDETERESWEQEIIREKALWEQTFNAVPDLVIVLDTDYRVVQANLAMLSRIGLSSKEAMGKRCHELIHGLDAPPDFCPCTKTFGDSKEHEAEVTESLLGGTYHVTCSPLVDSNGKLTGAVHVARDITERKNWEKSLKESEERYRIIGDFSHAWEYWIGLDGKFIYCSPYCREMTGYAREDFLRIPALFETIVHPDDRQTIMKHLHSSLTSDLPDESLLEFRIVDREGRTRWVEHTCRSVISPDGKLLGRRGSHREISLRKVLEQSLLESEETNRMLIEEAPVGVGLLQGDCLVLVNPEFVKIFGYDSQQELLELPIEEFYAPEERPLITQRRRDRLLGKSVPPHYEVKGLRKNGQSFDLAVWPRTTTYRGEPAILTFCVDRTEQKALRSQLLQSQKMEAVGTLAGGLAHDFNNLLQVMLGHSELLLLNHDLDDRVRDGLQTIRETAGLGADLVRRLLAFSRKGSPRMHSVDVNEQVRQVKSLLERTFPKMIAIELFLEKDLPRVLADPVQVEQILMNLAINAKDAMVREEGKLSIQTQSVILDEGYCRLNLGAKPGQNVLISVSDTGCGMTPEILSHIFEPFFTTKGVGKGTGLGLAMVYGIVQQHGGHVRCESELGRGTRFRIYLPVSESNMHLEAQEESSDLVMGSETILLVDDEAAVREIGSAILRRGGYKVITATNGVQALDVYKREGGAISLVILDKVMPEMGGLTCIKALRQIDPHIRIVLSSGVLSDSDIKDPVEIQAMASLRKPYKMSQLLQTVRTVLDQK